MSAESTLKSASRAEQLRARRSQQSQQRVTRTRSAASKPVNAQPIVSRNPGFKPSGTTPRTTSRNTVRRQYYYSLGATGAELRLPALPMIALGPRLISAALTVILALAMGMLVFSDTFEVSTMEVQGIQRLTPGDLEAVLSLNGTPVVELNPAEAEAKLAQAFPELTDIHIQVGLPAKVNVSVIERQPVLIWNAGETTYWIDAEGFVLPPRGEPGDLLSIASNGEPPLLPMPEPETAPAGTGGAGETTQPPATPVSIWGRQMNPEIILRLNDLRNLVASESKLVYNTQNGLGWEDPRGWDVFIGIDLKDFDLKLAMYNSIVAKFEADGIQPSEMVSVEFVNAPFYK